MTLHLTASGSFCPPFRDLRTTPSTCPVATKEHAVSVNLRIPGPTPCPDDVLQAMSRQMINHRGPEFADIIGRITESLQRLFETKNDVLTLSSAGTGAIEAAVVNTLSPRDRALCVSIGVFGDRFADIAKMYGVNVETLS